MLQWDAVSSAQSCPRTEMLHLKATAGQRHLRRLSPRQRGARGGIIYAAGKSLTLDISAVKATSCALVRQERVT